MHIIIHRGTHQIGGVATEIKTAKTRIVVDMGDELSLDPDFQPKPLSIPGVTDEKGSCDAVLFTHNHGDHVGQIRNIRSDIPLYMGSFAKEVLLATIRDAEQATINKIQTANSFVPGKQIVIGDMCVTPFSIDHSACDSYMFLVEAEGKRILHTGDFRLHGFRGKAIPKILDKFIGKVDVLITEGTTLSRSNSPPITERELQDKVIDYMKNYKYVFVYCASTNLERICALSKAVPRGKYFVCDEYQYKLLDLLEKHWGHYSPLYRNIKKTKYGDNLLPKLQKRGFLMMARDNWRFRNIVSLFDRLQSIMLYSMWDGYRTKPGSTIPAFLDMAGTWETLHTSGHASQDDIRLVIEKTRPAMVIPIHTENPNLLKTLCPDEKIVVLSDGEDITV